MGKIEIKDSTTNSAYIKSIIVEDNKGTVIARIFILPNGDIHEDSWVTVTSSVKNGLKGTCEGDE